MNLFSNRYFLKSCCCLDVGLRHVIANEGFKGAFAGIVPTYAKVIPSVMITKTVADALISYGDAHGWRG